ncbi:tail fiber protein [Govanella unica]|uniref:Tail fiber protein n=1 Tax=Govanella unica TaxID=2975056 RepID=A0A9X3Z6C8_9PROT|nr:tail fiber protein [Govania unica]MDA5192799.1 tail fiber protein [Govania unica]
MTDLTMIVTNAGRAALVNAENTGTQPVLIAQAGISATALSPTPATAVVPDEIKRIGTLSGDVVADDTIHLIVRDETSKQYTVRTVGLYLADGTLFAVYGQAAPIIEKSAQSMLLLAIDIRFADVNANELTFGDSNFLNPPATVDQPGVIELATGPEAIAGTDAVRAVTPSTLKAVINDRFGAGAPTALLKTILNRATAALVRDDLGIKAAALKDEGAGNGLDADKLDGQEGAWYADIAARLGFSPTSPTQLDQFGLQLWSGAVMAFAMPAAPTGWLKANGAAISRTTYAKLFAAIGTRYGAGDGATTFNLPDLRGEFLRGFDDGRGIDVGRVLGAFQDWAIKDHIHPQLFFPAASGWHGAYGGATAGWGNETFGAGEHYAGVGTANSYGGGTVPTPTRVPAANLSSSEVRPRNVALLFCIKY